MGRRRNTFSKALRQLKSEEIDNRIQLTETMPTNNTMGVFISMPPGAVSSTTTVTRTVWDQVLPDFDADGGGNGQDTSGLFQEDGTPRTAMPPGDTSYILGPMSSMWYAWGNFSTFGYIRESDRKMVNLGTIVGKLSDWDQNQFNSYGQLTLEQARWFYNTPKKDNAGNDPDNANYRAFYPGPPSNTPDAFGRYLCTITGTPKEFEKTPPPYVTNPTQGPESASDQFSGMLNQLMDKLKGAGNSIGNALNNIKDFFGDHITPAAAEYATNIAKSILQNKPITVKQEDVPQGDIDKFLNNLEKGLENYTVHNFTVSQGDPIPYADENIYGQGLLDLGAAISPVGFLSAYSVNLSSANSFKYTSI